MTDQPTNQAAEAAKLLAEPIPDTTAIDPVDLIVMKQFRAIAHALLAIHDQLKPHIAIVGAAPYKNRSDELKRALEEHAENAALLHAKADTRADSETTQILTAEEIADGDQVKVGPDGKLYRVQVDEVDAL